MPDTSRPNHHRMGTSVRTVPAIRSSEVRGQAPHAPCVAVKLARASSNSGPGLVHGLTRSGPGCAFAWWQGSSRSRSRDNDYCLLVSTSVTVVVSVGAVATLESPGFSVSAGSAGVSEALGVAVTRGLNQRKNSRSTHAHKAAMKW